jgi:hypothetical protein
MEHKVEKDLAKEKILTAKSAPEDTEVKVSPNSFHSSFLCQATPNPRLITESFFFSTFFSSNAAMAG